MYDEYFHQIRKFDRMARMWQFGWIYRRTQIHLKQSQKYVQNLVDLTNWSVPNFESIRFSFHRKCECPFGGMFECQFFFWFNFGISIQLNRRNKTKSKWNNDNFVLIYRSLFPILMANAEPISFDSTSMGKFGSEYAFLRAIFVGHFKLIFPSFIESTEYPWLTGKKHWGTVGLY